MINLPFDMTKLTEICHNNDIVMLGVFGSMARGDANEKSDVDLLVRFSEPKSLLYLVALEQQFAEALNRPVDLLTEAAISPHLRDSILEDLRIIYEA